MKKKFALKKLVLPILVTGAFTQANATDLSYNDTVYITADNDGSGDNAIYLRGDDDGNPGNYARFDDGGSLIYTDLIVSGSTSINSTLSADGFTNDGALDQNGTADFTGTTTINTSGTAATSIGNSTSGTVVTARGGDSSLSLVNGQATLSSDTDATVSAGADALLTGGNTATVSSGAASFTSYSTGQTVVNADSSSGVGIYQLSAGDLASQAVVIDALSATDPATSVSNIIVGNTLVDGNVYINGSLTYSSDTSAVTSVTSDRGEGVVVSAGTTVANAGSARYTVDANGALVAVDLNNDPTDSTADGYVGTTAALTVTNQEGNTHGVVVTESQTTLSGGVYSSSMTLDDNGATFSDSATGAPIQVHGVNDGTADFDAVNVRQFAGAIAATAAMGNIPALGAGENGSFGLGVGSFMGYQGLAMGGNWRVAENTVIRATLATNTGDKRRTVAGVGAAWSW